MKTKNVRVSPKIFPTVKFYQDRIDESLWAQTTEAQRIQHFEDVSKMVKRKSLMGEDFIAEIKTEFLDWLDNRKYAPTIKALKHKLNDFAALEMDNQRKKMYNFNEEQAEIISNNIIQKITNHFAHHLKEDPNSKDESLELIKKVFHLEISNNA